MEHMWYSAELRSWEYTWETLLKYRIQQWWQVRLGDGRTSLGGDRHVFRAGWSLWGPQEQEMFLGRP